MNKLELQKTANEIRKGVITAVHSAKSGHPGGSLSAADILTYLYFVELNIDPTNPQKADRDRFVLSKGHIAPGLYSTLAHRGFFPVEDLKTLRHVGSYLQGHPDMKHIPGVDMSSGSLGQGISAAVGMALSAKLSNESYRVYALIGDGELQEGQVWEASMFVGHRNLDNLTVNVDNNNLQIDGAVCDVCSPYPIDEKFKAFNFHVINVDGHDFDALEAAFKEAKETKGQPSAIIAKTVKGKNVSFMENNAGWHGAAPNDEQYAVAMADLEKVGKALGEGMSAAIEMALTAKSNKDSHRVYAFIGDNELLEEKVWEASMLAGQSKLDNLTVVVNNNQRQTDGVVDEAVSISQIDQKFKSLNFHVIYVNANDSYALDAAFEEAKEIKGKPTAVITMADLEKVGEALCQK